MIKGYEGFLLVLLLITGLAGITGWMIGSKATWDFGYEPVCVSDVYMLQDIETNEQFPFYRDDQEVPCE